MRSTRAGECEVIGISDAGCLRTVCATNDGADATFLRAWICGIMYLSIMRVTLYNI